MTDREIFFFFSVFPPRLETALKTLGVQPWPEILEPFQSFLCCCVVPRSFVCPIIRAGPGQRLMEPLAGLAESWTGRLGRYAAQSRAWCVGKAVMDGIAGLAGLGVLSLFAGLAVLAPARLAAPAAPVAPGSPRSPLAS
jgi:hypothetical protein